MINSGDGDCTPSPGRFDILYLVIVPPPPTELYNVSPAKFPPRKKGLN